MKILIVALALFFGVWAWKIRIYLKWERKKKENVRPFYRWDESVHREPEQIERRRQASEESFSIQYQDEEKGLARIRGANDPAVYWCNLGMCQCEEFKKTHKPCKHIYKIALDKGLIEKKGGLAMKLFSIFKKSTEAAPRFNDNMNYMIFEGEGIYSKTGRKRKIHIESFSESEAVETLAAEYNPETISISRVPFEPPSEDQISAMRKHGNKIPKNACKIDITFYMHKIIENQHDPGSQLINFATNQKVKFSYFTGEKSLYDCIWGQFSEIDKAAFYILCVKKDKSGKWYFDRFDQYRESAKELLKDEKFVNSFKRYINSGFYGFTEETTSRSTNCYKVALTI